MCSTRSLDADWGLRSVHDPTLCPNWGYRTGNGGEYRKSFHSYPAPYAQLIESPVSWRIQPMQIDTKNRDGSMAEPGMPFKAGPAPRNSKAPVSGPDAVYSGLLECPCTDRITRSYGNIDLIFWTISVICDL